MLTLVILCTMRAYHGQHAHIITTDITAVSTTVIMAAITAVLTTGDGVGMGPGR